MKSLTNFLFIILLILILFLVILINSNQNFYQNRAAELNNSQSIILDIRGCNLINLILKNQELKLLNVENNMCVIDGDYKMEYVENKKYRLIVKKINLIIKEDYIISNQVKTNNNQQIYLKNNKNYFTIANNNTIYSLLLSCLIIFAMIISIAILYSYHFR